jgi:hypothetical protein
MGSFDCYCVLCAGPLGIFAVRFGSKHPLALKRRRAKVDLRKRRLKGEDVHERDVGSDDEESREEWKRMQEAGGGSNGHDGLLVDDSEDEDYDPDEVSMGSTEDGGSSESNPEDGEDGNSAHSVSNSSNTMDVLTPPLPDNQRELGSSWSQASDLSIPEESTFYDGGHELYFDGDSDSYDPEYLHFQDTRWLDRCRCLAQNTTTPVTKVFLSGRGRYNDYGSFVVMKPGTDPNDTGESLHNCCGGSDFWEGRQSFPVHEACLEVLARSLGYEAFRGVDKGILYGVMASYREDYELTLDLSYGLLEKNEQCWWCVPGEEVSLLGSLGKESF